jgi:hypothetical protein
MDLSTQLVVPLGEDIAGTQTAHRAHAKDHASTLQDRLGSIQSRNSAVLYTFLGVLCDVSAISSGSMSSRHRRGLGGGESTEVGRDVSVVGSVEQETAKSHNYVAGFENLYGRTGVVKWNAPLVLCRS